MHCFRITLLFSLLLLSGSAVITWKQVEFDEQLTVMFPTPYNRIDTLYQKMMTAQTDSSNLILSVMPGNHYSTVAQLRSAYDEVVIGYLQSFNQPDVLSKKEQTVNGIIGRRINLAFNNPEGKVHMVTVFVFHSGKHYAFQSASMFVKTSNKDLDLLLKSVRFKKE
jgi:hypothetical protein